MFACFGLLVGSLDYFYFWKLLFSIWFQCKQQWYFYGSIYWVICPCSVYLFKKLVCKLWLLSSSSFCLLNFYLLTIWYIFPVGKSFEDGLFQSSSVLLLAFFFLYFLKRETVKHMVWRFAFMKYIIWLWLFLQSAVLQRWLIAQATR